MWLVGMRMLDGLDLDRLWDVLGAGTSANFNQLNRSCMQAARVLDGIAGHLSMHGADITYIIMQYIKLLQTQPINTELKNTLESGVCCGKATTVLGLFARLFRELS